MQTLQLSKCRHCGALQPEGASDCVSCGAKLTPPGKAGTPRLHAVPKQGLDPKALLEKIDSLDWDPTTTMEGPLPAVAPASAPSWRLLVLPIAAGLVILLLGAALLFIWSGHDDPPPTRSMVVAEIPPAPPVVVAAPVAPVEPAPVTEADREADRAQSLQAAEEANKRRAEKKRKAAEQQAQLEEQERQRRAEEERLRLEREAAEARARAAAAVPPPPSKPATVRELCAKEDGLFARNTCEARSCALPEWRASEFCRQRWQEQMRTLNTP